MDHFDTAIFDLETATEARDQEWECSYILDELREQGVLTDAQYASFVKWDASASVKRRTLLRWKQNHL